MAENNKGLRRRRAFADFKETQYNDLFSLSAEQKKKKTAARIFKWAAIIIVTVIFIIIGFVFTDALMSISEKEYADPNTYTPAYVNTTSAASEDTTEASEASKTTQKQSSKPENN